MIDGPAAAGYADQCLGQFKALADLGHAFLLISVLLAAAFAFLSLVQLGVTVGVSLEALVNKGARQKMAEAGGAAATPIPGLLDSVKGLIGALSGAPAWFAVFLAGMALMWMATLFAPDHCLPAQGPSPQPKGDVRSAPPGSSTADLKPKTPPS